MELREINDQKELEVCVDLYIDLNDESFIPSNRNVSLNSLNTFKNSGAFFRVLEDNGKIVAWILAVKMKSPHTGEVSLQQVYYGSNLKGIKSVRAVQILHTALVSEAQKRKICRVISTGSHMDSENVFTRILEKMGWNRRSYMATYEV
jgi:hypothetical protein